MTAIGWEKRANGLKREITAINRRASLDSARFRELQKQSEGGKVRFLANQLEARRKSLARSRALTTAAKNGKGLPVALVMSAAVSILDGMVTRDRVAARNVALFRFNKTLEGVGETDWAVCLGRRLAIAPADAITPREVWFTWDSLKAGLLELEERAKKGAHLGDLDAIISELVNSRRLVAIGNSSSSPSIS